jgi:FtsZ-binding cell division protein ZapB
MNEIEAVLGTLENKILTLLNKLDELEQKNKFLKNELSISIKSNQQAVTSLTVLQQDFENLKITNSLLGSNDYKRDTKLKINSLVREIDYCIAQLAD